MVCTAAHCTKCHERSEGAHTCAPGARETARMVLAETKGCPRCHTAIMRSSGCSQMMCTSCNCVFNWTTGLEEKGVVHNPYYYQLSDEARQKVNDDRAKRGLMRRAGGPEDDEDDDDDLLCMPFEDPRMFDTITFACRHLFPVHGRTWDNLAAEFQNVLDVGHRKIGDLRSTIRYLTSEKALRLQRLARLCGPIENATLKRKYTGPKLTHSVCDKMAVCIEQKRLDDASYASLLMRQDTEKSRLLSQLEILVTYEETQKDQFRTVFLVLPSQRADAIRRIFEFRTETEAQLERAARASLKSKVR